MRRIATGTFALFAVVALLAGCPRVGAPRAGDHSLNGEKNLTNGVWMFGFDKVAARQLSDRARSEGLIAVRLIDSEDGQAQLQLIPGCYVAGRYQYRSMSTLDDRISIKSEDELKAKLPFSYGSFEGAFSQKSALQIEYRTPGDYVAPGGPYQLTGSCDGATHVITHLTIGAFRSSSSASMSASGGGGLVGGIGGSGGTSSSNDQATSGGSFDSCKMDFNIFGSVAPLECSMPLKLTLAPIGGAPAPAAPGAPPMPGAPVTASASTCGDSVTMANTNNGYSFDGRVFTIEKPHLSKMDASAKINFACLPNMTPAESMALDGVITFLKKRPGVRAHVSVYCTVMMPGIDPASADLHKQAIQGKFAAAGVAGQVTFDSCVGMGLLAIGDGVSVELVAGCTDLTAPPAPKCKH
ncbi:MAG: hypothetical protein HYV09_27595 [Deltaproteobacteria bacterium]|nr:hypothetical protein [Deltaproteobacteria bacterium]